MLKLNVNEAKAQLSRYLKRLEKGETIILCRRNVPIAEIRPLPRPAARRRPVGLARGEFEVGPRFFESLPEEVLAGFEGGGA